MNLMGIPLPNDPYHDSPQEKKNKTNGKKL